MLAEVLSRVDPQEATAPLHGHPVKSWQCLQKITGLWTWLQKRCAEGPHDEWIEVPESLGDDSAGQYTHCTENHGINGHGAHSFAVNVRVLLVRPMSVKRIAAVVVEPGVFMDAGAECSVGGLFQHAFQLTKQSEQLDVLPARLQPPERDADPYKSIAHLRRLANLFVWFVHSGQQGDAVWKYKPTADGRIVHPVILDFLLLLKQYLKQLAPGASLLIFTCGDAWRVHHHKIAGLATEYGCCILMCTAPSLYHRSTMLLPLVAWVQQLLDLPLGEGLEPHHAHWLPANVLHSFQLTLCRPNQAPVQIVAGAASESANFVVQPLLLPPPAPDAASASMVVDSGASAAPPAPALSVEDFLAGAEEQFLQLYQGAPESMPSFFYPSDERGQS